MNPENSIILLLEDSSHAGLMIQSTVLMSLPEVRLVWARTIEEARTILCETPVTVFLVDVELPDGNGIDFLMEAALIQPEARAVVMTGNPLPVYRERTAALGGVRFFEKPVLPGELLRIVKELLTAANRAPEDAFQGTIKNLTPIDLIQLKCMSNATTVVHFRSGAGEGRVYFEFGKLIHAETPRTTGQDALNEIVSLTGGTVIEERSRPVTKTLHQDWQTLLMIAAHAQDIRVGEGSAATGPLT